MAGFREFLTGEVLTAANVNSFLMNQSVMVFADGTARDSALGTAIAGGNALVEGMLTYNVDASALQVYDGTEWTGVAPVAKEKRIEAFTGSGTWTVPAGVTYAIAHMLGGGGSGGTGSTGNAGAVRLSLSPGVRSRRLAVKGFTAPALSTVALRLGLITLVAGQLLLSRFKEQTPRKALTHNG